MCFNRFYWMINTKFYSKKFENFLHERNSGQCPQNGILWKVVTLSNLCYFVRKVVLVLIERYFVFIFKVIWRFYNLANYSKIKRIFYHSIATKDPFKEGTKWVMVTSEKFPTLTDLKTTYNSKTPKVDILTSCALILFLWRRLRTCSLELYEQLHGQ